ncbi:hypothetical protein PputUW4_02197 [Pseudomonas sp. UW4]|nr:hypothetical protein PputUW4_02197 [Pseudomonas sp. UW4]
MSTLLEPPSSFFQSTPCISSLFAIRRRTRFSRSLNLEISSVDFSAITFPKTNGVISKALPPCIRLGKPFSLVPFALNINSAPPSRSPCFRAIYSFALTLREIE